LKNEITQCRLRETFRINQKKFGLYMLFEILEYLHRKEKIDINVHMEGKILKERGVKIKNKVFLS